MARVMTSGSLSRAGRPVFDGPEEWSSFHQSSTRTYNVTKKESRSIATPSFGESLVKHTVWAPSPLVGVTHQPSKRWAPSSVSRAWNTSSGAESVCTFEPRRSLSADDSLTTTGANNGEHP